MGTGGEKKPEVKILSDYIAKENAIFFTKKNVNSGKNLRSPIPDNYGSKQVKGHYIWPKQYRHMKKNLQNNFFF